MPLPIRHARIRVGIPSILARQGQQDKQLAAIVAICVIKGDTVTGVLSQGTNLVIAITVLITVSVIARALDSFCGRARGTFRAARE
ncbi:hypothetical protein [Kitasatospora sp. NPDC057015]|uniref:hypothetical protein n=1 Tax=Kitasatospora sp. NPDC057015 TaxID=3346001 RepID=UPI0036456627